MAAPALPGPWRVAFEQAWEAYRHGSIGVGAVVVDAADAIVTADRNRSGEQDGPAGLLFGSRYSHAEVNALAALGDRIPKDLRLLSTLQPCVVCAGAVSFARIAGVAYAAVDAAWDGVDAVYRCAPVLVERAPVVSRVDLGPWSVWAEVLPLAGVIERYGSDNRVGRTYRVANQAMLELAAALAADPGRRLGLDAAYERWAGRLVQTPAT